MNYQEIIENLEISKIEQLLNDLEIPYIDKGSHLLCKTACHNVDLDAASYKLYFYKDTKLFVCYTECGNQTVFKFLQHYYETRQIDYDWYSDVYQPIVNCSSIRHDGFRAQKYVSERDKFSKQKKIVLPIFSDKVLDVFIKTYPAEWLADRITKESMDKFNILYSISQNKIIIPHYDINNNLIGIRGRALDEWEAQNVGKYAPVKVENTWYKHPLSLNLYGLNKTKENIKKTGICFLGESEKFVLQMDSYERPNCAAAVCGSNLNKFTLKILLKECHPKEIVICFDKEEKEGQDKYFFKLWNLCKKYNHYCDFSFIYDRENLLSLKQSPTDAGEEVFEELLRKRVRVK
jgi:hypothetical protein